MLDAFRAGYSDGGGASPSTLLGAAIGLVVRTATQTLVVVIVLRLLRVV